MKVGAGAAASKIDMIMVREPSGFVMYMRTPALKTQLRGKTWLRLDFDIEAAKLGLDYSELIETSRTLGPLEHGIVSTTRIGTRHGRREADHAVQGRDRHRSERPGRSPPSRSSSARSSGQASASRG